MSLARVTAAQVKEEFDNLARYVKGRVLAAGDRTPDRELAIDIALGALLAYRSRAYDAKDIPQLEGAIQIVLDAIQLEYRQ